ncbi:hypothetical protein NLI96_g4725 [Meripilus lineatus]|uniref:Fungal lipase-type domain-containing protein n=1 Tax=Meripilus lineatus TaxID=2056292 RepID=A0AAD5V469_9APHY|nr:hypothetical protein NLI96_g4725 [Physisporinus lineatus]
MPWQGNSNSLSRRSAIPLTSLDISTLAPYTQLARAAYCPPSRIKNWGCGQACNAIPGFQPTIMGGDGGAVQYYFVGYWPSQNSVVVAHQGTDPFNAFAVLTDANLFLRSPSQALFPGLPSDISVHGGFLDQHEITATVIMAEVKRLLATKLSNKVILVGHSMGGALAHLDALSIRLQMPLVQLKVVTYGLPRVGNPAYAQYFDLMVPDAVRINNQRDVIPIIPGRSLGFQHTHGEIHLTTATQAVACSGTDNAVDAQCTIPTVPNIFVGNVLDHLGPYLGIPIGTIYCY